jgi:hypothetical protein
MEGTEKSRGHFHVPGYLKQNYTIVMITRRQWHNP